MLYVKIQYLKNLSFSHIFYINQSCLIKDDWINTINSDKDKLGINENDNELKHIKKNQFKAKIKSKIREKAFQDLNKRKSTHSKVQDIQYGSYAKQKYMSDKNFTQKDIDLLFKLRTNMISDVKMNFKGMYDGDYSCNLCKEDIPQTQAHLTQCNKIIDNCPQLLDNIDVEYEDIYAEPEKQLKITKLFRKILETRDKIMEDLP